MNIDNNVFLQMIQTPFVEFNKNVGVPILSVKNNLILSMFSDKNFYYAPKLFDDNLSSAIHSVIPNEMQEASDKYYAQIQELDFKFESAHPNKNQTFCNPTLYWSPDCEELNLYLCNNFFTPKAFIELSVSLNNLYINFEKSNKLIDYDKLEKLYLYDMFNDKNKRFHSLGLESYDTHYAYWSLPTWANGDINNFHYMAIEGIFLFLNVASPVNNFGKLNFSRYCNYIPNINRSQQIDVSDIDFKFSSLISEYANNKIYFINHKGILSESSGSDFKYFSDIIIFFNEILLTYKIWEKISAHYNFNYSFVKVVTAGYLNAVKIRSYFGGHRIFPKYIIEPIIDYINGLTKKNIFKTNSIKSDSMFTYEFLVDLFLNKQNNFEPILSDKDFITVIYSALYYTYYLSLNAKAKDFEHSVLNINIDTKMKDKLKNNCEAFYGNVMEFGSEDFSKPIWTISHINNIYENNKALGIKNHLTFKKVKAFSFEMKKFAESNEFLETFEDLVKKDLYDKENIPLNYALELIKNTELSDDYIDKLSSILKLIFAKSGNSAKNIKGDDIVKAILYIITYNNLYLRNKQAIKKNIDDIGINNYLLLLKNEFTIAFIANNYDNVFKDIVNDKNFVSADKVQLIRELNIDSDQFVNIVDVNNMTQELMAVALLKLKPEHIIMLSPKVNDKKLKSAKKTFEDFINNCVGGE